MSRRRLLDGTRLLPGGWSLPTGRGEAGVHGASVGKPRLRRLVLLDIFR